MWKQLTLTLLTTTYLVSSQELTVYFSEEEVQTNDNEEGLNSRLLTIRLDKESMQPGVMERLSKTSNIIFADFPGLPEFVNAKEYEDILNTLYNDKDDQNNSQTNSNNSGNPTDSMDDHKKEDERHIEIIEEEPKRENKEDYAKETLKDDHKEGKNKEDEDKGENTWHGKKDNDGDKSEDVIHGDEKQNEKDHKENGKEYKEEIKENNDSKKDNDDGDKKEAGQEYKEDDNKYSEDNDEKKHKNIVTSYTVPCKSNSTETGSVFKEKKKGNSTLSGFSTKTKTNSKVSKTGYTKNQNATIFNKTNVTTVITEEENNSFNLSPASMPLALLFATITFMLTF